MALLHGGPSLPAGTERVDVDDASIRLSSYLSFHFQLRPLTSLNHLAAALRGRLVVSLRGHLAGLLLGSLADVLCGHLIDLLYHLLVSFAEWPSGWSLWVAAWLVCFVAACLSISLFCFVRVWLFCCVAVGLVCPLVLRLVSFLPVMLAHCEDVLFSSMCQFGVCVVGGVGWCAV